MIPLISTSGQMFLYIDFCQDIRKIPSIPLFQRGKAHKAPELFEKLPGFILTLRFLWYSLIEQNYRSVNIRLIEKFGVLQTWFTLLPVCCKQGCCFSPGSRTLCVGTRKLKPLYMSFGNTSDEKVKKYGDNLWNIKMNQPLLTGRKRSVI